MQSKATTVDAYLASLPEDRRAALSALRAVFLKNLDKRYREGMQYGMIGYFVPHEVFPPGYHCDPRQPLPFAGMASQKGHLSLYMMCMYSHAGTKSWFEQAWRATGKKLDMGKACVRFKRIEDVPLEVVGEAIRRMPAKKWIEIYTQSLAAMGRGVDGKPIRKGRGGKAKGGEREEGGEESRRGRRGKTGEDRQEEGQDREKEGLTAFATLRSRSPRPRRGYRASGCGDTTEGSMA